MEGQRVESLNLGVLIPEFPGQTHAFFMRENKELQSRGANTHLISTRPPNSGNGAAEHIWAEKAKKETFYLFPMGFVATTVTLFQFLGLGPGLWYKLLRQILTSEERTVVARLKMFGMVLTALRLKNYCSRAKISHVHVHSCANAAKVAMYSCLAGGPSYSMTLHGPLRDYGLDQNVKWAHAKFCVVITRDLMEEVNREIKSVPRTLLAPMGVSLASFSRTQPYKAWAQGEELKLVTCGRINYVKAHDDLIRAVAELVGKGYDVKLTVCGARDSSQGSQKYAEELDELKKSLQVEDRIHFLGSISEERLISELENAHIFCLASLREPLGVAIMEAMAMEMPVVVASSPGVLEMVTDAETGCLVSPRNPGQIAAVVENLLANPETTLRMGQNARRKIINEFHSGISAEKILQGCKS